MVYLHRSQAAGDCDDDSSSEDILTAAIAAPNEQRAARNQERKLEQSHSDSSSDDVLAMARSALHQQHSREKVVVPDNSSVEGIRSVAAMAAVAPEPSSPQRLNSSCSSSGTRNNADAVHPQSVELMTLYPDVLADIMKLRKLYPRDAPPTPSDDIGITTSDEPITSAPPRPRTQHKGSLETYPPPVPRQQSHGAIDRLDAASGFVAGVDTTFREGGCLDTSMLYSLLSKDFRRRAWERVRRRNDRDSRRRSRSRSRTRSRSQSPGRTLALGRIETLKDRDVIIWKHFTVQVPGHALYYFCRRRP